ncbi:MULTISPECIES: NAD(P)H-binding protein [unclassified Actinomyces]|uniref:NAD(P)H-binding protein n=1 Tax=unclassified Actinomyces TaxID=2609248 RepID=UPI000D58EAFF|nr:MULTISPECIES: NAD(P)H-binding protein [unclassified Actinomyces]RAX22384.1 NAD-dependent epimerase/dehydratase family protein [Actinomyces sp. Z3]
MTTILAIGATGQVGRVVVDEALQCGLEVRAVTRNAARARRSLADGAEIVEAAATDAEALRPLLQDVDAVVLTHGTDNDGKGGATFYDVVRAVVDALGDGPTHISLMTTMNASHSARAGASGYEFVEWKRRAERLVRASGHPYTIVRPGWFDYQGPADRQIDLRQGDLVTGQPGVDRRHIAQVLLEGALNPSGARRTVEVFSKAGAPVTDFEALFAATRADEAGALDGVLDTNNVPLASEPQRVQDDVARFGK